MRNTFNLVKREIIYAVGSRYITSKLDTQITRMLFFSERLSICARQMNTKFYIFPFYKVYFDSTSLRRAKENYFIKLLKPKLNRVT